ncbi:MAG: DUF3267 domain-containing protein [Limisphaerales bacterium]
MTMKGEQAQSPTVEELKDSHQFQLLAELTHKELATFVADYYWKKKSWVTVAHYLFSLVIVAVWVFVGLQKHLSFDVWLTTFGNGVVIFIVLLPLHEAIHGAVYKICGAKDVRYGVSFKQFYAYAIAHRFVAGRTAFAFVAITPFVVINTLLGLASVMFPEHRFFLLAVRLLHTAGTSGDWAMLNFLWLHRRQDVYTFDDAEQKKSYFYKRDESVNASPA